MRLLNWSAERDEEEDFELNIRAVSGGAGLIVQADGITTDPTVVNLTPLASANRNQLKVRGINAWDAIKASCSSASDRLSRLSRRTTPRSRTAGRSVQDGELPGLPRRSTVDEQPARLHSAAEREPDQDRPDSRRNCARLALSTRMRSTRCTTNGAPAIVGPMASCRHRCSRSSPSRRRSSTTARVIARRGHGERAHRSAGTGGVDVLSNRRTVRNWCSSSFRSTRHASVQSDAAALASAHDARGEGRPAGLPLGPALRRSGRAPHALG